ncbi:MAG: hypothetical protein JSU86_05475 [Phycisphaerales bacterium]|nr:MAG: hypothetical protein JSU86_05475 [Phycisphaerales bacterium]
MMRSVHALIPPSDALWEAGPRSKEAASTSEMSRFETEWPSSKENLTALMNLPGVWIDLVQECAPLKELILDKDSSESET